MLQKTNQTYVETTSVCGTKSSGIETKPRPIYIGGDITVKSYIAGLRSVKIAPHHVALFQALVIMMLIVRHWGAQQRFNNLYNDDTDKSTSGSNMISRGNAPEQHRCGPGDLARTP